MLLPDDFVKAARPHPFGKRGIWRVLTAVFK
jgi:hypothetical protein